jgi:restriction system protein
MQLKMAKNSLFAVLLRSPWWYSILIAGAIVTLAYAVLGDKYAIFGACLALPFLVIGAISGYKQMQRPSGRQVAQTDESVRRMTAREFTALLSATYKADGYQVAPFKGKAADLILDSVGHGAGLSAGRSVLVSCKRVKAATCGTEPLRALVAAGEAGEVTRFNYVTLGELSPDARKYAAENRIEIVGLEELAGMLAGHLKV